MKDLDDRTRPIDGDGDGEALCDMGVYEMVTVWYKEADGDGFGNPDEIKVSYQCPTGYVADNKDCDDTDPNTYHDAPEICDGKDNDCDGVIPDDERDDDNDGHMPCEGDCDDTDPTIYMNAPEIRDGKDNDCDGRIDETNELSLWSAYPRLPFDSLPYQYLFPSYTLVPFPHAYHTPYHSAGTIGAGVIKPGFFNIFQSSIINSFFMRSFYTYYNPYNFNFYLFNNYQYYNQYWNNSIKNRNYIR